MKNIFIFLALLSCIRLIKKENEKEIKYKINEVPKLLRLVNDINFKDGWGWTPLMYACWEYQYCGEDRKEVVETLIKKGADVNNRDNEGRTPLFYACRHGYKEIAEVLINAGAEINCEDAYGYTPLHWTFLYSQIELTKLLINKGANLNYISKKQRSILSGASVYGSKEVIKLLIEKGARFCLNDNILCTSFLIIKAEKEVQKIILKLFLCSEKFNIESLILIIEEIISYPRLRENLELRDSILENIYEEISIDMLFSLDNFTFSQKSLFIRTFSYIIETHDLKNVKEIKKLKKDIIELFVEYYKAKLKNYLNYKKEFINKKELMEVEIRNILPKFRLESKTSDNTLIIEEEVK